MLKRTRLGRHLWVVLLLLLGSFAPASAQDSEAMTVCQGPYALCAAAACLPIPREPNGTSGQPTEALCSCVVAQGTNIGPGSCEERVAGAPEGQLMSTYSFGLVATHPSMVCSQGAYTNCFGAPCLVDSKDATKATCTCPIDDNTAGQPFVTQGGNCDTETCRTTLWSSTTPAKNALVNKILATAEGLSAPPTNVCSSTVETAASERLCADYCYQVMGDDHGVCVGEYQIYDSVPKCLEACKEFPIEGAEGAVSGNSVQCRTEHAILAQGAEGPEKHCPHAAPGGGGVCIDRSPCEAYCVFYYDRVSECDCPLVERWGLSAGTMEPRTGRFTPNPKCLETCAGFAEAGQEWEMSGDSANCRQQFFLMAHRQAPPDPPGEGRPCKERDWEDDPRLQSLCRNAQPFDSEMCQGYTFGDYYKVRQTDPCKELCYNDWLSCGSSWGTPDQCMEACQRLPATGQRQDTQGDNVYCRLTWAQYAFFVKDDPSMQRVFCDFAKPESFVCHGPGSPQGRSGLTLPPAVLNVLKPHH